jgi:hypothetical protein
MVGLLFYNAAVTTILMHAAMAHGLHGIALWPVVLLHGLLAVWCIGFLRWREGLVSNAGNQRSG